jgi:plasmid stability protein
MRQLTVRNFPDNLLKVLRENAARNGHSISEEAQLALADSFGPKFRQRLQLRLARRKMAKRKASCKRSALKRR